MEKGFSLRVACTMVWSPDRAALIGALLLVATCHLANSQICPAHCSCSRQSADCAGRGFAALPVASADAAVFSMTSLELAENHLAQLELTSLASSWPRLKSLDLSRNRIRTVEAGVEDESMGGRKSQMTSSLEVLNLSQNGLQVLHPMAFALLGGLTHLNLSYNSLHSLAPQALLHLPHLTTLDLSHNQIAELQPGLLQGSGSQLRRLHLSHNRISRLLDGSFARLLSLLILDLSHNNLMDIEDSVLVGMNITLLNLGHNAFRRLPTAALHRLTAVTTLVLDGAMVGVLEAGALSHVPVKFLSLAGCPHLTSLEAGSLVGLDQLETLTLNGNPNLAYVHPGALSQVPSLVALDLTNNNLSALEDLQPYVPSLRSLYLAGNSLRCHCGLRWLQTAVAAAGGGFVIQDGGRVHCIDYDQQTLLASADLSSCRPFILPLFPAEAEADMGHNISWPCRPVGGGLTGLAWELPNGTLLPENAAGDRAVVQAGGELTLSYLHPGDEGVYSCRVGNQHGEDVKSVRLHIKLLHIQIFPLTVADTFVTLSWNTSRSLARDFVLHVAEEGLPKDQPPLEYSSIEVGLKMASYTISGLRPSTTYTISLVMKKGQHHLMEVSSMRLRTRPEHYLVDLGIEKDYTAMAAVGGLLVVLAASCLGLSAFRLYKLRCCCRLDGSLGDDEEEDDNRSTKQILSSGSEPSSIAGLSAGAGAAAFGDKSRLVENEVASPTDDTPAVVAAVATTKSTTKMAMRTPVKATSRSSLSRGGGGRRTEGGLR